MYNRVHLFLFSYFSLGFTLLLFILLFMMFTACTELSPTNPYDPRTPSSQQIKGNVKGTVRLAEGEQDIRIFDQSKLLSNYFIRLLNRIQIFYKANFLSVALKRARIKELFKKVNSRMRLAKDFFLLKDSLAEVCVLWVWTVRFFSE